MTRANGDPDKWPVEDVEEDPVEPGEEAEDDAEERNPGDRERVERLRPQ